MKPYLLILTSSLSFYTSAHTASSDHIPDSLPTVQNSNVFGDVRWKFKTNGKVFSSPAVLGGIVYIGSEDTYLYAVDMASGKQKWKFKTGGAVHTTPAVHNQTVYVGSFDGYYYAVDTQTGLEKWKVKTGGEKWIGGYGYFGMKPLDQYMNDPWDYFLSSPVVGNQEGKLTVYFGSSDGNVYAVDGERGVVRWKFPTGGIIHASPLLYNQTVYIGSWDTYFYAIDANTGKLKWKFKTGSEHPGFSGIQASASVANDMLYFGARDAHVYALQASTGELVWKYDAKGSWILATAAVKGDEVYVGTSDSYLLLTLDGKTGLEKSRFKANGYVFSSPAIAGTTIFFGDFTGKMFAVDLNSAEKKWSEFIVDGRKKGASATLNKDQLDFQYAAKGKDLSLYQTAVDVMNQFYELGSIVSSPVIHDNTVYFGSADGFLYAINLK